jgi:hypothetical protein
VKGAGGWTIGGSRVLVSTHGAELLASALHEAQRDERPAVFVRLEHLNETARIDLDHARRVATVSVVDDAVAIARAA